jgi:hypothetical protein
MAARLVTVPAGSALRPAHFASDVEPVVELTDEELRMLLRQEDDA